MTVVTADTPAEPSPGSRPEKRGPVPAHRRVSRSGSSLLARGEPMLWLTGGGLVVCLSMVIGLLVLVFWKGMTTFWPVPVVQITTVSGQSLMGEVTRQEFYELTYGGLDSLDGPELEAACSLLHPELHSHMKQLVQSGQLNEELQSDCDSAKSGLLQQIEILPIMQDATGSSQGALLDSVSAAIDRRLSDFTSQLANHLNAAADHSAGGKQLYSTWSDMKTARDELFGQPDCEAFQSLVETDTEVLFQVWCCEMLDRLTAGVSVRVRRRLVRTGNFDLTGNDFQWVDDFEIEAGANAETHPEWALLIERLAWGRFYGFPEELRIQGRAVAPEAAEIWGQLLPLHAACRRRWQKRRDLEKYETGNINAGIENARLKLREVALEFGQDSEAWQRASTDYATLEAELQADFEQIRREIVELDELNGQYTLLCRTADGQKKEIVLADIVRIYPANRLTDRQSASVYGSRWSEFLVDDPREANSEGGVFPAIFGTVIMTLMMSVAVVPFGVLAALYLREYAKSGPMVSVVRIAVNNLAGVPSIVFGVFGLGFFCYILGTSIDDLFYYAKLPNPTYGTGGLMWASFTLALLTLPVVIVATEEALAAVPRSMREGSLACGATKWQTIRHIVLPRAMPGIMTGTILAMARGAGEVAPLMLVGAVKLAPELGLDLHDFSGSLGWLPTGPLHPERSFMHLGFHIYDLGFQSRNSEAAKPMVFTTTLLLIGLIAAMNLLAVWLRARLRKKFQFSQF